LIRDYRFNRGLVNRFWQDWLVFYLPTLQGRNKWRETAKNLEIGQLVLVGASEDIANRENYRVSQVSEVFPKMSCGKPIVRRASIAVSVYDPNSDSYKVDQIFRDISRIAPVEGPQSSLIEVKN